MPRSGFYNQNLYRDYPFQTQGNPLAQLHSLSSESSVSGAAYATTALPHEVIVDYGCIMGLDSRYTDRQDWIYLYRVTRSGVFFTFEFRTTANSQVLIFTRRFDATEYAYEWAEAVSPSAPFEFPPVFSSSSSVASEGDWWYGCDPAAPAWEGFLVTGKFDELIALVPPGTSLYFDSGYQVIEPARTQNLKESYVRSVNLANRARTHALHTKACLIGYSSGSSVSQDSEAQDIAVYEHATCIQRAIALVEGYNCQIRQEDTTNTLVIGAGVGLGAGEVCEEYPFYPGESANGDEPYFTGGPTCTETLKTINGKGGSHLRFEAGPGFTVRPSPDDPSTIIVDMALTDFAICLDPVGLSLAGGE